MQKGEKLQKQSLGVLWQNAAAANGGRGEEGGADPGKAVARVQSLHSAKGGFLFKFLSKF